LITSLTGAIPREDDAFWRDIKEKWSPPFLSISLNLNSHMNFKSAEVELEGER
jgi:hypothetical protein